MGRRGGGTFGQGGISPALLDILRGGERQAHTPSSSSSTSSPPKSSLSPASQITALVGMFPNHISLPANNPALRHGQAE